MAEAGTRARIPEWWWPLCAILLLLAAQATMVFTRAINWDEFFFYSQVAEFVRGELNRPLNTFHVRLFSWLPAVASNGVDAIVIARIAMFACEMVTVAMIVTIASRFADRATALLAGLCYLSAGYVLQHGFSFRVDPGVTAALTVALAILARSRLSWIAIAGFGLAVGLAGMITVKAIFFAPAFVGLAWLRWSESGFDRGTALRLLACGVAGLAMFGALYVFHAHGLAKTVAGGGDAVSGSGKGMISAAGSSVFFIGMPPYAQMMIKSASLAIGFTALLLLVPITVWLGQRTRGERVALLCLWLPILTLAFYRNTAPYYYAFILAPVAISVVPALEFVQRRFSATLVAMGLFLLAIPVFFTEDRSVIANQRAVVSTVEQLFEEPVAYFDHNGMIAPYRKANIFMTPWGVEGYRQSGKRDFVAALAREPVPLLLENDPLLTDILRGEPSDSVIFPEDRAALKDNFLAYWGPVWLAGKAVPAGFDGTVEIAIPGRYRVEGGNLVIDGTKATPGDVIELDRGSHIMSHTGETTARLIWADVAKEPIEPPPDGALWIGF